MCATSVERSLDVPAVSELEIAPHHLHGTRMRTSSRSKNYPQSAAACSFGLGTVAAAVALVCVPASAQVATAKSGAYAVGRLLVMPRAGLPDAALSRLLRDHGARGAARRVGQTDLRIVDLPPGNETAVLARLAHNPHLKFAELDMRVAEAMVANDPYLGSQWHLSKIAAPSAWDTAQGGGIIVAILDSGIDTKHPDFAGRLVPGYNFVDGNTNVEDVRGHGTKVAGSAAAAMNNGLGVASVAGMTKIMPIRVSDSSGYVYWSDIAAGLTWAADHGARIANMSFNGVAGSASVLSAAKYMKDRGGLSFVSAGNDNLDPGYASTNSMIIVAATDSSDSKASFSNYGDHVHLSAPGAGIYTTTWGQTYGSFSGTSYAAPVAAGVAALIMSANPGLSSNSVESILFATAVDLGAAGRDNNFGYGRVNAAAAVAAAAKASVTGDTAAPIVSIAAPLGASTVSGLVSVNVSATDNIGVTKVELRANGALAATDTVSPYGFSWDSAKVANGMSSLTATAYDAAGNAGKSSTVSVNVANVAPPTVVADTTPPMVAISNPGNGARVSGTVTITITASDNSGSSALSQSLHINGKSVASATGGSLTYRWNTRKIATGSYTVEARATDAAGNTAKATIGVSR
jgi:thermitase